MIPVTELRSGATFEDQGQLYEVLIYSHIKMGRGTANIKLKVRNLKTGSTTEKSFISGAKVKPVNLAKIDLQYLYKDNDFAYFMNPKTYEQISVPAKVFTEAEFLKEGNNYTVSFHDDEPLSILLPPKMEFEVTDTGPGIKGNSTSNIYKDATLENNIKVKVPLFIKIGDRVLIDTKTKTYHEKSNTV